MESVLVTTQAGKLSARFNLPTDFQEAISIYGEEETNNLLRWAHLERARKFLKNRHAKTPEQLQADADTEFSACPKAQARAAKIEYAAALMASLSNDELKRAAEKMKAQKAADKATTDANEPL